MYLADKIEYKKYEYVSFQLTEFSSVQNFIANSVR